MTSPRGPVAAGMAVYLAAVLTLSFIAFWPGTDNFGAYIALWVLCLPTSVLLGPFSFIAAGLADLVLDDLTWLFNVAWWCLVAAAQIIVVSLLARLLATARATWQHRSRTPKGSKQPSTT
jgi:hypothetical protein